MGKLSNSKCSVLTVTKYCWMSHDHSHNWTDKLLVQTCIPMSLYQPRHFQKWKTSVYLPVKGYVRYNKDNISQYHPHSSLFCSDDSYSKQSQHISTQQEGNSLTLHLSTQLLITYRLDIYPGVSVGTLFLYILNLCNTFGSPWNTDLVSVKFHDIRPRTLEVQQAD